MMATTTPVHIYLPILPTSDNHETEWWLRFAAFAVCGAKGYLAATEAGDMVDHEHVSFENLANQYYYVPESNEYHPVDYQLFDDQQSLSTDISQVIPEFRRNVCRRDDNRCIVTRCTALVCDAAHIIPMRKGSDYITFVVHDRAGLYEQLPFSREEDIDINCLQNGITLRKDLHARLVTARIAFLKTPNFAMTPTDVPRVELGSVPNSRVTLQYMEENLEICPLPQCDFVVDWSHEETASPPSILLDFMYGAAIVKHWMNKGLRGMLQERFQYDFSKVLAKDLKHSTPEDDGSDVKADNLDDDWEPQQKGKKKARKAHSPPSTGLLEAMDDVLLLSMLLKGITPQMIAEERARREKEKELRSREHSCEKVEEWLDRDHLERSVTIVHSQ